MADVYPVACSSPRLRARPEPMRLTIALLGLELDITLGPATDDDEADTPAPEVPTIGGETGTTWLDTGAPDRYMGFTGGWDDPEQ